MGAGALPGRSEAVGSGTNQEKHDPEMGTRRAQTPLPTPPPDTRERHGPPPHSDNPKRHSLPSHGQTYPPWNPHGRDGPPSQRSLTRRCLPKRLSHGQHKPSQHQDSPTQGRNGSRGPPSGESGILEPLGEKTIQRCSALFQVLQDRHPHRRDGGGPETSLPGSFRDSFSLEKEPAQD